MAAVLIYRHRNNSSLESPLKSDPENAATAPDLALPGPIHEAGTVRRRTGQPQTFHDWMHSSNNGAASAQHARCSASEHGPGPMIDTPAFSMYSRSIVARARTMAPESRPVTRDSMGTSSLRKAVLGAAEADEGTVAMKMKQSVAQEPTIEIKKAEEKRAKGGYSGTWP
jgi:hypothetical protein